MRNFRFFIITFLAIFLSMGLCLSSFAGGGEEELMKLKPGQPIVVDGDKVEYFEHDGKIVAEGNVSITYGDIVLTCDKIEVNSKARTALCEGNVRIEQPEGVMTGDRIYYDFNKKKGELVGIEVRAYPWYGQAEEVSRVAENEYLLKDGYVTTCDLEEPHYRLQASEIKVYPDDKVIAKNVVMYIGKVPVMWWPYYYHPIIQTKAKVQFIPGFNSDWGYFLLSAWRFHIKGNTKVDVLLDYRHRKGLAEGANFYYNMEDIGLPTLGKGVFRSYFIQENDPATTIDPKPFRDSGDGLKRRQRLQWKHRLEFEPETIGMLEFNKLSDENVIRDYFYNEYEENNRVPQNYASVISSKPNYIFGINFEKRLNDFYTVTQRLPEITLDIPDQRLWETPLYYSSELSATYFEKEYKGLSKPSEEVGRFDYYNKLSYMAKLGFLNITPFGDIRETLYTRNKWDHDAKLRSVFGGGVSVFSRFHKIYDVESDLWGLDIDGLRHIIVPSATYYHAHQPTVDKDGLYQMDDIDKLEKENTVTLSLENKLQTRRGKGENKKSVNLVRFIVSTDYLFRMEKEQFKFKKEGKFRNLTMDLELTPYSWLYIDNALEVEPKNQSIKKGSIEASFRPSGDFRLDMGYRYEKLRPDSRNQFTFDVSYRLNKDWKFGVYERFNFEDGTIEEQQFSILKDLHCWELEIVYDIDGSNFLEDDFTLWFAFKIKAFPDLQLGLSRSFEKDIPGSQEIASDQPAQEEPGQGAEETKQDTSE